MQRKAGDTPAVGLPIHPPPITNTNGEGLHGCSLFKSAWDNVPQSHYYSWDELKSILSAVYFPSTPGEKRSMPAISGAIYPPGVRRGKDTAEGVGLLLQDYDNSIEEPIPGEFHINSRTGQSTGRPKTRKVPIADPVNMDEVIAQLQKMEIAAMAWTTWSNTSTSHRFRVVVPLSRAVTVDNWERSSEWALNTLGLNPFRRGLDIPVLKNAAALAFLSGSADPSSIVRAESIGKSLTIPIFNLPRLQAEVLAPWQVDINAKRQADGERWWMRYKINGRPIDYMNLDLVGILAARGIVVGYPRAYKGGTKWRAHCPWACEHSSALDDDCVVLIKTSGSWPTFHCSHSGHRHMGLRDLLEWAWGQP